MPALLLGTAFGGVAPALADRGSLQMINGIAPEHERAEVVASYLIASFLGNSLPVIGVGLLSRATGPATAHGVFAAVIALLAVVAMAAAGSSHRRDADRHRQLRRTRSRRVRHPR